MPGNTHQKAPESISPDAAPSKPKAQESTVDEPNLAAEAGVDAGEILDGIDEGGEMVDSIKLSEKKEGVGEHRQATGKKFGDFKKKMTKEETEALKIKLLEKLPAPKAMVREIRAHVNQEIHHLEKEAAKHQRKARFKELAAAVARMRELKNILADLIHSTAEMIKNIWLKVVHGIV
ncbi:hypothetical protein HN748_06220 [Candidatus Peregrinibacteria bacterium]|jgi:hypothetical protein|nr:hypothetical protein [Candidatus Peregrinibacteria bacterium]MBT7484379.1 hypothetical protein [Candidatus Peregrinibacteria bacterium]MBT7703798.1 hypothetical protein [Candidatus Peregrinibacteria bacterium]